MKRQALNLALSRSISQRTWNADWQKDQNLVAKINRSVCFLIAGNQSKPGI